MKKYMLALCAVFLLTTVANAALYLGGSQNTRFDFLNWENQSVDLDTDGKIDDGDTLRGVLKLQNNAAQFGPPVDSFLPGSGNPEYLAVFEIKVSLGGKVDVGGGPGPWTYTFEPYAPFAAGLGLPADTMMALYALPTTPASPTAFDTALNVSVAATEAVVTSGAPVMALGYSVAAADGYWISNATSDDLGFPSTGSAEFFYGLNVLPGWGTISPGQIAAQTSPFLNPFDPLQAPFLALLNDFVGEGDVTPLPPGNGADAYLSFSDDPALSRMIPEPLSALVWVGLLGACAMGASIRRRKNRE